jgi:branched-chain amino acid transport system substrate-binding protein
MTQYAAFLPKELYIPAADFLKSDKPAKADEAGAAKQVFYKAFDGTDIKPDGPSTYAWDPASLVVTALRKLKPDATAADLRGYFNDLKGVAGINGFYDFKAVPNRGLDESNVVVTRWDPSAQTWTVVSDPLGIPK